MTEEFNLSDKIHLGCLIGSKVGAIDIKEVKEFIRRLKEETNPDKNSVLSKQDWIWVMLQIDKFAGNKLI